MNPNTKFPQSISPLEHDLGFHLEPILGLASGGYDTVTEYLVVALRLSSSEILLKGYDFDGNIGYYHKKYGYDILPGAVETPYSWHAVSGPWKDPKEFLEIHKLGIKTTWEKMVGQIHGVPYPFKAA